MFDLLKKALLTGVGLAALTKTKIEELGTEIANQAKMSEQEGKQFVDDLLKRSEQARHDLDAEIDRRIQTVLSRLNLASKDDIATMTTKLEEMERRLAQSVR